MPSQATEVSPGRRLKRLDQTEVLSDGCFDEEDEVPRKLRRKTMTVGVEDPEDEEYSTSIPVEHKKIKHDVARKEPPKSAPPPRKSVAAANLHVDDEDAPIGGGFQSIEEIHDALPPFLKANQIRDKDGRRPDDPDYDETTLHIPQGAWKDFTPAMSQYWAIKRDNNEKILFFKLGKFYEIFYSDAIICQRALDLNWMGGAKKLHVGFPEKALDKYLSILVNMGHKVAVIE